MNLRNVGRVMLGLAVVAGLLFAPWPGGTHAQGGEWEWQNPLPTGHDLWRVWGSGENDVFAVGQNGTIVHYDGVSWDSMTTGTTALLLGVAFAVGLGLVATLLGYAEPRFPVVVGLGIFTSIIIAAALGTFIPLFFDRMSIDPAVASGPLVTTSADVMGIGGFFLVAYLLL